MNDWDQAKPGELWVLTRAGVGTNVWLRCRHEWRRVAPGLSGSISPASAIQADSGYLIWSEPTVSAAEAPHSNKQKSQGEQVIYEYGDPRYYCMGCDHYHDPAFGCPVVDAPGRPYVINEGRFWRGRVRATVGSTVKLPQTEPQGTPREISILNEAHRVWVGVDRGTHTPSDLDQILDPRRWAEEPSDAYVLAALNRYYAPDGLSVPQSLSDWPEGAVRAMRAVLRGDFEIGDEALEPQESECYFVPGSAYGAGYCHTHGEDHETYEPPAEVSNE